MNDFFDVLKVYYPKARWFKDAEKRVFRDKLSWTNDAEIIEAIEWSTDQDRYSKTADITPKDLSIWVHMMRKAQQVKHTGSNLTECEDCNNSGWLSCQPAYGKYAGVSCAVPCLCRTGRFRMDASCDREDWDGLTMMAKDEMKRRAEEAAELEAQADVNFFDYFREVCREQDARKDEWSVMNQKKRSA